MQDKTLLKGFGGWLLVLAIGMPLGFLRLLLGLNEYANIPANVYADYPIAFRGALISYVFFIGFSFYVLWLFFTKRDIFILIYGKYFAVTVFYPWWEAMLLSAFSPATLSSLYTEGDVAKYFAGILAMGIWYLYILKSIRVKNTFVNKSPSKTRLPRDPYLTPRSEFVLSDREIVDAKKVDSEQNPLSSMNVIIKENPDFEKATHFFPSLIADLTALEVLGPAIQREYVRVILEEKLFTQSQSVFNDLVRTKLKQQFGDNSDLQNFGYHLLKTGETQLVADLEEYIRIVGEYVEPAEIIERISMKLKNK